MDFWGGVTFRDARTLRDMATVWTLCAFWTFGTFGAFVPSVTFWTFATFQTLRSVRTFRDVGAFVPYVDFMAYRAFQRPSTFWESVRNDTPLGFSDGENIMACGPRGAISNFDTLPFRAPVEVNEPHFNVESEVQ